MPPPPAFFFTVANSFVASLPFCPAGPAALQPPEEAVTQHAGTREAKSRVAWSSQIGPWLSNPLLVTVVAALLGSWLLPQITRQWQDHQKALEIQTGLVSDMSTAVSSAV